MKQLLSVGLVLLLLSGCGGGGSSAPAKQVIDYDVHYRVSHNNFAEEVDCPKANREVWLVSGQSNAASYAEQPKSTYPGNVVQFYHGKCYTVSHPVLGASGDSSEATKNNYNPFIAVAEKYSAHTGKTVVLSFFSIGGRQIERWYNGDYRYDFLTEAEALNSLLGVDRFLWQQGETDHFNGTTKTNYLVMFRAIVTDLKGIGVSGSIHVARSSTCNYGPVDNQIGAAHDELRGQYPGPNTDTIMGKEDRPDECHFGSSGVEKFRDLWVQSLTKETP